LQPRSKRIATLAAAVLGAGLALLAFRSLRARAPTTVTVSPATFYQTIDGWGVYPRYWEDDKKRDRFDRSFEPFTKATSDFLVDELGINAVRVEIWSGLENPRDFWLEHYEGKMGYREYAPHRYEKVNDDGDPRHVSPRGFQFSRFDHRIETMVLPLLRAVERRGEKPLVDVCYVDFKWKDSDLQGSLSHADEPEEFAEFVSVFFDRLRDKWGIVPDTFEVILEPENTERWRGAQIGRALLAASARLAGHGFSPRIVAPSNTSMSNAISYFDEMITVPSVLEHLDTFAYHRYHLERTSYVEDIWQRAAQHGKKTAMLEKVGAGIDELFEDLTVGHVSAWQQWAVADRLGAEDKGAYYAMVDTRDQAHPRVLPSRSAEQLAQVFRYVRRGARRVGAESDNSDKRVVAFVNAGGRAPVVVRAGRAGGALGVRGLPPGRYGRRFVADDGAPVELGDATVAAGGELSTRLPGPGVLAIHVR